MRLTLGKVCFALGSLGLLSADLGKADIVYTGVRTAGTATANLSITTDGTIGVLETANIKDWSIAMTDGPDSFTLQGPLSGSNSQVLVFGSALSATATGLFFDFTLPESPLNAVLFQSPHAGSGGPYYCLHIVGCGDSRNETFSPAPVSLVRPTQFWSGVVQIASAQATGVPEPSEAVVYVSGVALALGQLRRRVQRRPAA